MEKEMEVVKRGMQHGDLSLDAYTQVCLLYSKTVFRIHRICTFLASRIWIRNYLYVSGIGSFLQQAKRLR
jgi:hypothetical protein